MKMQVMVTWVVTPCSDVAINVSPRHNPGDYNIKVMFLNKSIIFFTVERI
jgi:hypothetical protein